MIYLLDTNACIQFLNRRSSPVVAKLKSTPRDEIRLCDIVKAELYYGAYRSRRREQNLALYQRFFGEFVSFPFDGEAAAIYGSVRAELEAAGTPIGAYDLQIAVIALAHHLTLVTHNVREFERVKSLQIEDWEVE